MPKLNRHRWVVIGCLACALLMSACAGPWKTAPDRLGSTTWTITPPLGWMHLSMPDAEMLSKNGPYLEYILIQSRPLATRFRYTDQDLTVDMLPHEAAQLIIDNLRSDPIIRGFRLLTSEPAMVAGRPGFRLTYRYRDKHDVETQTIHYGALMHGMYFNMRYTAAGRHYFDQALPVFNHVFESLRFSSDRAS